MTSKKKEYRVCVCYGRAHEMGGNQWCCQLRAALEAAAKVRQAAFKSGKVGRAYYIEVPVPDLCGSLEPKKVRRAKP